MAEPRPVRTKPRFNLRKYDYAAVVRLRQEGWRNIDIATHLRIPKNSVNTIIQRCRAQVPLVRSLAFKEALTNPKSHPLINASIKRCKLDELTIDKISQKTGYSRGAIGGWLAGRIPSFNAGVDFIEALGFRLVLEPIDEKPRVRDHIPNGSESRAPY